MLKQFMDHTHPDAFVDWPMMEMDSTLIGMGYTKVCTRCKGHGGWNLELNAYNLRDYADTPENRHRYSHFRSSCGHCNGWGYVAESETCTGHDWEYVANVGRCLNQYKCVHCGKMQEVDSSD